MGHAKKTNQIREDKQYERAKRHALKLLKKGFNLRGKERVTRDELHER